MIKIEVRNRNTGNITNGPAIFETQSEVNAWVSQCEAVQAFGKKAKEAILDENGEVLEPAVEQEYEIETQDITEEIEAEKTRVERVKERIHTRKNYFKNLNLSSVNNVAQVRAVLKEILDHINEEKES